MVDFYVVQTETGKKKLLPLLDVDEASYEAGKAEGIKEAGGCTEDHDAIRQTGYNEGYTQGKEDGLAEGGCTVDHDEIRQEAYEEGRTAGLAEASGNSEEELEAARAEGYASAEASFAATIFKDTVAIGAEAASSISINVPFKPTFVMVQCVDKVAARSQASSDWFPLQSACFDLATTDVVSGAAVSATSASGSNVQNYNTATIGSRVSYANGVLELKDFVSVVSSSQKPVRFAANAEYMVFCTKGADNETA